MRIFLDTEFIEDGRTITPVSFGLVRDDGATYYAISSEFDPTRANEWVHANVLPSLGDVNPKPLAQIAVEIVAFAGEGPEFWADYAAYDWVVLCQLFGDMAALPDGWPMFCGELQQLVRTLGNPPCGHAVQPHNALSDARRGMCVLRKLDGRRKAAPFYDAMWRQVLAEDLRSGVEATVSFEKRFADIAGVGALGPTQGPRVPGSSKVAWCDAGGVRFRVPPRSEAVEVPPVPVTVAARLDLADMCAWSLGGLRGQVVYDLASEIVNAVWQRIDDLYAHAESAPTRESALARLATRSEAGAAMAEYSLLSGVQAVANRDALVLTTSGSLQVREALAPDGESWLLTIMLPLASVLWCHRAYRLHAQAPGPV